MLSNQNGQSQSEALKWFVHHPIFGKQGPYSWSALSLLIQRGKVNRDTKVWNAEMQTWGRCDEVEEFKEFLTIHSLIPNEPATLVARVISRFIDFAFFSFPVALAFGILFNWLLSFVQRDMSFYNTTNIVLLWIILLIALLAESMWLRIVGNTPGRKLMQIRLQSVSVKRLTLSDLLTRNFKMLKSAFGLGMPLLWIWCSWKEASRLYRGKETSYDESSNTYVTLDKQSFVSRFFLAIFLFIIFYWSFSLSSVVNINGSEKTCVDCESSISYLKREFPNLDGYSNRDIAIAEFHRRGGHKDWFSVTDPKLITKLNSALDHIQGELELPAKSCQTEYEISPERIIEQHTSMYLIGSQYPQLAATDLPGKLVLSPAAFGIGPLNFAFFGKQPRCPPSYHQKR